MSPILTRPIREQLEHDRIIRQLQARYKRKHDVAINPGPEQNQSVQVGELAVYPDLVLFAQGGKRLEGTVEVETGESVNQLEALAEWGVFSKLRAPFHLYVPPQSIESARRICDEHQFPVAEIWTYHLSLDQVRFTQVYRSPNAPKIPAASKPIVERTPAAKPAAKAPADQPAKAANGKPSNGKPSHAIAATGKPATGSGPAPAKATKLAAAKAPAVTPNKAAATLPPAKTVKGKVAKPAAKPTKPAKSGQPATSGKAAKSGKPANSGKTAKSGKPAVQKSKGKPAAKTRR